MRGYWHFIEYLAMVTQVLDKCNVCRLSRNETNSSQVMVNILILNETILCGDHDSKHHHGWYRVTSEGAHLHSVTLWLLQTSVVQTVYVGHHHQSYDIGDAHMHSTVCHSGYNTNQCTTLASSSAGYCVYWRGAVVVKLTSLAWAANSKVTGYSCVCFVWIHSNTLDISCSKFKGVSPLNCISS